MATTHPLSRRQVLALAAAGLCSGAARAQPASDPLVIAQTAALSGPLAYPFVEMNKGIQAAFEEANTRGGIEGRRLQFISLDDGGSPQKAAGNAALLLERDKPLCFFACGGTASVMGLLPVATQARAPVIAPATGSDALRAFHPLVIHTRTSYSTEIAKIVQQLGTLGLTRCAVAYGDNPFSQATLAAFDAVAKRLGNTDWKAFALGDGPGDVARTVDDITAWQPQALMSLAVGANGIPFYKALRQKVKAPAFSISFLGTQPLLDALGDAARGITVAQVVPHPGAVALPLVKAYHAAIARTGTAASYSSLEGYIGARLLAEGLRRCGRTPSRERLVAAFESMQPYDPGGYEVRYGPQDHEGSNFVELTFYDGQRFRR